MSTENRSWFFVDRLDNLPPFAIKERELTPKRYANALIREIRRLQGTLEPTEAARHLEHLLYPPGSLSQLEHPLLDDVLKLWQERCGCGFYWLKERNLPKAQKMRTFSEILAVIRGRRVKMSSMWNRYFEMMEKITEMPRNLFNISLWGLTFNIPYWDRKRAEDLLQRSFVPEKLSFLLLVFWAYVAYGEVLPPLSALFEKKEVTGFGGFIYNILRRGFKMFWDEELRVISTGPGRYQGEMEVISNMINPTKVVVIGSGPIQPFEVSRYFPGSEVIGTDPIFRIKDWVDIKVYKNASGGEPRERKLVPVREIIGDMRLRYKILKKGKGKLGTEEVVLVPKVWDEEGKTARFIQNLLGKDKASKCDLIIVTNVLRHYSRRVREQYIKHMISLVREGGLVFIEGGSPT